MKIPFKTYVVLTLVSLFYGINYSVLKVAIPDYIGAYGLIVYRVVISAGIFWVYFLFCYEPIRWRRDGWRLILCACTGVGLNQLSFFKGISMTSAINGSIIMTLTPVLVLLWAYLLTKEKITPLKVVGIFTGLIGAVIIFYEPAVGLSGGNWQGDLLILINAATYACYLVIVKPLMSRYQPITILTWIFTLGIPLVTVVGYQEAVAPDFRTFPTDVWLSIGFMILVVTVIVYFLNAWTLRHVPSSVVGAFIYLQPVFATLTALLFFEETFLIKHLLAAGFIFLGVWMVTRKRSNQ